MSYDVPIRQSHSTVFAAEREFIRSNFYSSGSNCGANNVCVPYDLQLADLVQSNTGGQRVR